MSREHLALDLPELRHRLAEHQATRPSDLFGAVMQTWMKTKDSLTFAIELKEAEARQQPFYITVPHQPIEIPKDPRPPRPGKPPTSSTTQEVRHADSPGHAGAPGALSASEAPMPNPKRGLHHDPQARIAHLVNRIRTAAETGTKLYWAQQEIRDICARYNLEIPPDAQKCRPIRQPEVPLTPRLPKVRVSLDQAPVLGSQAEPQGTFSLATLAQSSGEILSSIADLHQQGASKAQWERISRDLALCSIALKAARQIAEWHGEAV